MAHQSVNVCDLADNGVQYNWIKYIDISTKTLNKAKYAVLICLQIKNDLN